MSVIVNIMHKIKKVWGREILDSRGNPTIEVDLWLTDESFGRAAVPSGASTGTHEAIELRDGDQNRYGGKGTLGAVSNINKLITQEIENREFDQKSLDELLIKLDGTENKSRLGANAILGVSLAFAKAAAKAENKNLWEYFKDISTTEKAIMPRPMMNILNGGAHAQNSTDIQEFMIVPKAPDFREALRCGAEIFHALRDILIEKGLPTTVGDEGGFAPKLNSNEEAFGLIMAAIAKAGYKAGEEVALAIDVASSEFYNNNIYDLKIEKKSLTSEEMINLYEDWLKKYPIISIEDGLSEDDWGGWKKMTEKLGAKLQIVGDDLFATNPKRLQKGIDEGAANSILIKLNQIGTVSETIDTVGIAKRSGFNSIVSHRSGETEDSTIADFAVGLGVGQIKTGSLCRSDRTAKYNQLLRIEEQLNK